MRKIIAMSMCAALVAAAPAANVNVRAIFAPVAARLKSAVRIPVLLPSVLPAAFAGEKLYPIVEHASSSSYTVDIALAPGCNGAHACSAGYIYGSKLPLPSANGARVKLDAATSAAYRASVSTGPYPSNANLYWRRNGAYYELSLNTGSLSDLLLAARSMRSP